MMSKAYQEEPYRDFSEESPQNPESKCLWVLCIDTSYSMTPHMDTLHRSLKDFKQAVSDDPVAADRIEVAIVEFNKTVKVRCAPKLIDDLKIPDLSAEGTTFLVEGVERAIQVVDHRIQWYKDTHQSFYQPYIILITDGEPNGPGDVNQLARTIQERVHHADSKSRFFFMAFGVDQADMKLLGQISDPAMPPLYVQNADFASLFQFLSTSVKLIGNSSPMDGQVPQQIHDNGQYQFQTPVGL